MQQLPNPQPRINTRKLAAVFIFGLLLPVGGALVIDLIVGSLPVVTIVASVVFLPIAAILISRVALSELDHVIHEVAPPDAEIDTQHDPS